MPPKRVAVNGPAEPKAKGKAKKPRAPKSAHKLAEPLPDGEILQDVLKKRWRLGKGIGVGGFGLIYLASDDVDSPVKADAPYVIKIEPQDNGPLFCELAFYQRVSKPEYIQDWMTKRKVKKLGVPKFIATGPHVRNETRYRFMVMQRFGTDLQKMFEANSKRFSRKDVCLLAIKMLDVLEYIHEKEYVHADIKASNILEGYGSLSDQVFLVDYGLAYRYVVDGQHKPYKEDPRKAHDGTIEFTSRDAHNGVCPARRGDLEILGYCLLQWLCSQLPWENKLTDKEYVKSQKIKYMKDIPGLMKTSFPDGDIPTDIMEYLKRVCKMKYEDKPDYDGLRKLFKDSLKKQGVKESAKLDLRLNNDTVDGSPSPAKKKKRKMAGSGDAVIKKTKYSEDTKRKVAASPRAKSSKSATPVADEEKIIRKVKKRKATTAAATTVMSTQTSPGLRNMRKGRQSKNTT